jgi:hypothetical protein
MIVVLHAPLRHAMPFEQQAVLSLVCTQPVAELQLSAVHGLLSLQLSAGPPTQTPLTQ